MKTFILQNIGALMILGVILATVLCAWLVQKHPLKVETALYAPRMIWLALTGNLPGQCFANVGEGTHEEGLVTKRSDGALTTRYLLMKEGTDEDHVAACGAGDLPVGLLLDEAEEAEDLVAIQYLSTANGTVRMVASEAIDAGEYVYTAAAGKVQDAPTGATVYRVGVARSTVTTDGDIVIVEPCVPTSVVFA